ncbi:hypothetical protein OG756_05520 [Streptomyces sp. NBC_01310]|uniref:hypothetical protein n=1 Tax=Streptomyces sp. NBC_01310 TaxID=2903820 RepID=UPI0035B63E9B|nr:hypothetical protein OG756_05520 [Streptomyces sp. NBC_01310]
MDDLIDCHGADDVAEIVAEAVYAGRATVEQGIVPDKNAGRIAPQVAAVWHGRVYGKTADGPLALDARTGAGLPTRPGVAPYLVNEYTGLALSESDDALTAYPTNG